MTPSELQKNVLRKKTMNTFTQTLQNKASWRDYLELCKPRVVALMIITTIVGMCLATRAWVPISILIFGNLGIALCAGSAAAINHLVDRHIDGKMRRTDHRPIVQGKISPKHAVIFAVILAVLGMSILICFVNTLTAVLTFSALIGYAFVYTLYLKHATPQNIVIGGAAGAAPPLLGWVAVTGHLDLQAWLLMLIIFVWTPPHFWALAIARIEDYRKAEVPMLPNTHGIVFTKICIVFYTLLLIATTWMPFVIHMSGWFYFIAANVLNAVFLFYALRLYFDKNNRCAMRTFWYSIWYLLALFVILLIDHYVFF